MRATLEFDLPDDEYEYRCALNGADYASCVFHYDQDLRSALKYDQVTEEQRIGVEWARGKLWEWLNEYKLDPTED